MKIKVGIIQQSCGNDKQANIEKSKQGIEACAKEWR